MGHGRPVLASCHDLSSSGLNPGYDTTILWPDNDLQRPGNSLRIMAFDFTGGELLGKQAKSLFVSDQGCQFVTLATFFKSSLSQTLALVLTTLGMPTP